MIARFLQQRPFGVPVSRSGVRSRLLPPIKQATESRAALILSSGVVIGPPFFTLNALRTLGPTVLFIKIFKRTREALIIFNDACSIGLMNHVWIATLLAQSFHVMLHDVLMHDRLARAEQNSKMEVLPAELHPHVDAIDIEEGSWSAIFLYQIY